MASGFFSVKKGYKGEAADRARYGSRTKRHERKAGDLVYCEDGNLPVVGPVKYGDRHVDSYHSAEEFFIDADLYERKKGVTFVEVMVSIPIEVPDIVGWAKSFTAALLDTNFPYRLAVHCPTKESGQANPHLHLMFSPRVNDHAPRERGQFFRRAHPKRRELGGARKDARWMKRSIYKLVKAELVPMIEAVRMEYGYSSQSIQSGKRNSARP